jgi:hypothetical protein
MIRKRKIMGRSDEVDFNNNRYWINYFLDLPPEDKWVDFFNEAKQSIPVYGNIEMEIQDRSIFIGVNSSNDVNKGLDSLIRKLVEEANNKAEDWNEKIKKRHEDTLEENMEVQEEINRIRGKLKDLN